MNRHEVWKWLRGVIASLLASSLAAGCIAHNGFRVGNALIVFGYLLVSLGCVFVGIWRQWDFEIVGWVLLGVFLLGAAAS